jgi:hypothetical protein
MSSEFERKKVAVPEEERIVGEGKSRVIIFRSIGPSSTAGLKRGIGISSSSISDLTYFSTHVYDYHLNGPQRKPIKGIPRQGFN